MIQQVNHMAMGDPITGRIFNIQRMSLHDGPGIRTTVFFKGCNLRCFWCHNPESWSGEREIQFFPDRCIGCGNCISACPLGLHRLDMETQTHVFDREGCIRCGRCAVSCPSGSLVYSGKSWEAEELLPLLLRDRPFYRRSGGGVTLSGGEPLLQSAFSKKLLGLLKEEGVNTAVESAFNVPWDIVEEVRGHTDLFLIDFKCADEEKHRQATGCSNRRTLENIFSLDASGSQYCIRIPVIPGFNDDTGSITDIYSTLRPLKNISYVEFMPYHSMGLGKFTSLSLDQSRQAGMKAPSRERLAELAKVFGDIPVKY